MKNLSTDSLTSQDSVTRLQISAIISMRPTHSRQNSDSLENELELSRADDATVTNLEKLEREYKACKECSIKREEYNKVLRKLNRVLSEFTSTLNKNADVQTALNKLTSFARILTKNKNECATKASSAKLAIAIDDKDLRDKLNALISITVK